MDENFKYAKDHYCKKMRDKEAFALIMLTYLVVICVTKFLCTRYHLNLECTNIALISIASNFVVPLFYLASEDLSRSICKQEIRI